MGWEAQQHRVSVPALEESLGHLQTLLFPRMCWTTPPQHLQPPSRTNSPRDMGIPNAQHTRTCSPAPSPTTATSGQLLKPQVPGNSLQPYKQQQAHGRQHACLLKEKHNGSGDAQASKFTRVPKSGAHIWASYKEDAKQPPRSIPVTSRLTGAAFHAAALRGNLIHFLIRHQLPPLQCSQMGEIYCLLHPKMQPWEAHPGFTRRNEHYCQGRLLFSTKFARGKPGAGSKRLVLVKAAPVRARVLGWQLPVLPCGLHRTFSRHSPAAEASGSSGGGRTSCHTGDSAQGTGPPETGLALGV